MGRGLGLRTTTIITIIIIRRSIKHHRVPNFRGAGGNGIRSDVYTTVKGETKHVFSLRDLKVVRESLLVTSEGSEFQTDGPEHWKARFAS